MCRSDVTLSACILAKNETSRLKECIEGLINVVDEVVVVDNGSTDDTASLARSLGARVVLEREMELDLARNAYIEAARGDWLLVLDTDERIDAKSVSSLRRALSTAEPQQMGVLLPLFDYIGSGRWTQSNRLRAFRKHPRIRYNWPIHGSLGPSIEQLGGSVWFVAAPIHHLGALEGNVSTAKRVRYTALLKRQIADRTLSPAGRADLHYLLGLEYASGRSWEVAELEFQAAESAHRELSSFAAWRAQCLLRAGQQNHAQREALGLLERAQLHTPVHIHLRAQALTILADLAVSVGHLDEAENYARAALLLKRDEAHLHINMAALIEDKSPQAAISHLDLAVQMNPYLLEPVIYQEGHRPNLAEVQHGFLGNTLDVFSHFERCYKRLGQENDARYWERQKSLIVDQGRCLEVSQT